MKLLFIHQNFPGQYAHILAHLARDPAHQIIFVTQSQVPRYSNIRIISYAPFGGPSPQTHPYLRDVEIGIINGQAVARICEQLQQTGFVPDLIVGHNGWGEILYVKDVWPDVPLLGYFEFFYKPRQSDMDFDPEYPSTLDSLMRLHTKNAVNLMGLNAVDRGQSPTEWQRSRYPARYRDDIIVMHEGVDTDRVRPAPEARFVLDDGRVLTAADEVVTYVSRNLEPYRGFHRFMRALPQILVKRPRAEILVIGGNGVSYGRAPPEGHNYKTAMLDELDGQLDLRRVHFTGSVPYDQFLAALQISSAHVYLSYPFVLSWSVLEAMSAGCIVLGSATPPVEEVLRDGVNGRLFGFFDTADLVRQVVEVLSNQEGHAAMRASARQFAIDRYDLRTVILPRWLQLFESLAARHDPMPDTVTA